MFNAVVNKFHYFNYKRYLIKHRRLCTKCDNCDAFISIAEYERHLKDVHEEEAELTCCCWCRTSTIKREELYLHQFGCLRKRLNAGQLVADLANQIDFVSSGSSSRSNNSGSFVVFIEYPDNYSFSLEKKSSAEREVGHAPDSDK